MSVSKQHSVCLQRTEWPQRRFRWCIFLLLWAKLGFGLGAQEVDSVAGAFAGYADGALIDLSQFDTPSGLALDAAGNLYVADRGNRLLRKLDFSTGRASTVAVTLDLPFAEPIAVVIDPRRRFHVADFGANRIATLDLFGKELAFSPARLAGTVVRPTALAMDAKTNLYVAELGGRVRVFDMSGAWTRDVLFQAAGGFPPQLWGVAVLENGSIAVSDAGAHLIRIFNPLTQEITDIGTPGAGFQNGAKEDSKFNTPQHLAVGPQGSLVVADRLNHRIRMIACDGSVSTLYGVLPWFDLPELGVYPGWFDGPVEEAEAREPFGVTIAPDGTVYTTEVYYHIIRSVTGVAFPTGDCGQGEPGPGGTGTTVAAPVLAPNSGYYPMGRTIEVRSSSSLGGFGPETRVFYTTNGSEPTTNSPAAALSGGVATIPWRESQRDLTALRVKVFSGTNSSATVSGARRALPEGTAGFVGIPEPRAGNQFFGGSGATLVLPVVAEVQSGLNLRSLQFLVEVAPSPVPAGAPPIDPALRMRVLPMSANDFVAVQMASTNLPTTITNFVLNTTFQVAVAYVGTNEVFGVNGFAVVAMLAVPIPPQARVGDRYQIGVRNVSATSDGVQGLVSLAAFGAREIEVKGIGYRVGDSAPGFWYNAGDFGSGKESTALNNDDVNNVFYASLGFRLPHSFSDVFDAMDVFPEDTLGTVGGDQKIRFLDWQILLRRSLGLSSGNAFRRWDGGVRIPATIDDVVRAAASPAEATVVTETSGWDRPVLMRAGVAEQAVIGGTANVPVYVEVDPGASVSGLEFRAAVLPMESAPPLSAPVRFVAADGIAPPSVTGNTVPSVGTLHESVYAAWDIGRLEPSLQGRTLLGYLQVPIPAEGRTGQSYAVIFRAADGSPAQSPDGSFTQYDFETVRGAIWVRTAAAQPPERIPDEWKAEFLAGESGSATDADADLDGDGFSNWAEYRSGFNPAVRDWKVRWGRDGLGVRWFGEAGQRYQVERSDDLKAWAPLGSPLSGQDGPLQCVDSELSGRARYYQVKRVP